MACGRGEAPILFQPPCEDERARTVGGYRIDGIYEISPEAWRILGTEHSWSTSVYPDACLRYPDKEYDCEVLTPIEGYRDCLWADPICTCVHDGSEEIPESGWEYPMIEITQDRVRFDGPFGNFKFCRTGDVLRMEQGPSVAGVLTLSEVLYLRAIP